MKQEKFMKVVEDNFKTRKKLLSDPNKKRTAGSSDRLINFKRMAMTRNCTTASAAVDLCTKQFIDIIDMANETHDSYRNINYLIELVSDVQNYLDIVVAIKKEEQEIIGELSDEL